ncbi:MAG: CdaR family protein [Acidobacteriota bacterium]
MSPAKQNTSKRPRVQEQDSLLGLKLLSLVLAVTLWLVVSSKDVPEETSQRVVQASVTYSSPPPGLILLDPLPEVEVRLRARESVLRSLNPQMVAVVLDLSTNSVGSFDKLIGPENVLVPEGIDVVSVAPANTTLELDVLDTRLLPVRVELDGEPAAGSKLIGWQVDPEEVTVTGPRTVLQGINNLATERVVLDTHALSFDERSTLRLPNALLTAQPNRVRVTVELQPPEAPTPPGGPADRAG